VDVQAGDEVVVAPLRGPGRQIALDPVDALGDLRRLGRRPRVREGVRGEVDRGDPPTAFGEPERVGPATAAGVEGVPGTQVPDRGAQMRVRGAISEPIAVLAQGLRLALLPGFAVVQDAPA
jgi:hypothetical protein